MNLKKLKRLKPPPVPGQVKLLSLLAIVLVCGAPALVSVIDDSMQSEQMLAMGSYTEGETLGLGLKWDTDTPEDAVKSFSFMPASENDGTNVFVLDAISSKDYMTSINSGVISIVQTLMLAFRKLFSISSGMYHRLDLLLTSKMCRILSHFLTRS